MIRTTSGRASAFKFGERKKDDRAVNRPRSQGNANNITHRPDHIIAGSFAGVAIQQRLGLLSERRTRFDPADRDNPGSGGKNLTAQRPGFSRGECPAKPALS